jgi:undecaprenyl diphosphate synthase
LGQTTTKPVFEPSSRLHELTAEEMAVYRTLDAGKMPQHVAIIMDGNGRWAGKRALKRFLGHQQGAESVQFVVETASRINLPFLTLYAFSLENNLRRPKSEVNFLMKLLRSYLVGNVKRMNDNNVRMEYIGRIGELPSEVQDTMQWATESTAKNTGTTLTLALNYGSRSEIVDAARGVVAKLIAEAHERGCSLEDLLQVDGLEARLDEHHIAAELYTAHMPDVGGAEDLEFSAMADCVFGDFYYGPAVAGLSRDPSAGGDPELPEEGTAVRRAGRDVYGRGPGRAGAGGGGGGGDCDGAFAKAASGEVEDSVLPDGPAARGAVTS